MRILSRLLVPLAALAAGGACIPCAAAMVVVIHNLSGGTLAVSQPWSPEPWDPLAGTGSFNHRLLGHGQHASFRLPGVDTSAEVVCVIHRLQGDGRFRIEGLEIRALEFLYVPVVEPPRVLPGIDGHGSGRIAPEPGTRSPEALPEPAEPRGSNDRQMNGH